MLDFLIHSIYVLVNDTSIFTKGHESQFLCPSKYRREQRITLGNSPKVGQVVVNTGDY